MAGHGAAGGAQAVLAEGIFLAQHGDLVAISAHQIVNDPVDFGLVAGPQVEHHRPEGLPQQAGAGEGATSGIRACSTRGRIAFTVGVPT
jgi:hypothetical protein